MACVDLERAYIGVSLLTLSGAVLAAPTPQILDFARRQWSVSTRNNRTLTLAKKTDAPRFDRNAAQSHGSERKGKAADRKPHNDGLPSKQQIVAFINTAQGKVGKREIARAFGVSGGAKIALKRILTEMADEGTLAGNKKDFREKGKLPPVTTLEITGRDRDGDLVGKPLHWEEDDGKRPIVRLIVEGSGIDADIGIGDRVLVNLKKLPRDAGPATYDAIPIKKLPREKRRLRG